MTLYFVAMDDVDGKNKDLFVRAENPKQALAFAMWYFRLRRSEIIAPINVFEVPAITGPCGPVKWHSDVPRHTFAEEIDR
jgi:hypothetical protein